MYQKAKRVFLQAAKASGAMARMASTSWRSERLLVLCYHGISIEDEHRWNPGLYLERETFRQRLELLREGRYAVLPLTEAMPLLAVGKLPPRSVALTFDDGSQDFYTQAYPLLKSFGFPATLYLTTYYCRHQMPVFDTICSYLLWKGIGKQFDAAGLLPEGGEVDIRDDACRQRIVCRILEHLHDTGASAGYKQVLAQKLAAQLGVDYENLGARHILCLVTPEQVAEVSRNGIDIQLHTHRHRTPRDRLLFLREIEDNAREIRAMTEAGRPLHHFCYPSGDYSEMFSAWLREAGIRWATTGETGLAERTSNPLRLPRLLDVATLSTIEVEAWLTGFSAFLPHR